MSLISQQVFRFVLVAVFGACVFLIAYPIAVRALNTEANKVCVLSQCTMTPTPGKPLCPMVTCCDSTNNFSSCGKCATPSECKVSTDGTGKGVDQGLQQLMKALGDLLGKLKGGGGGGDSPPPRPTTPTTGCTGAQFQTSDISQISNPCAKYVPSVSGSIDGTGAGGINTSTAFWMLFSGVRLRAIRVPATPRELPTPTSTRMR